MSWYAVCVLLRLPFQVAVLFENFILVYCFHTCLVSVCVYVNIL